MVFLALLGASPALAQGDHADPLYNEIRQLGLELTERHKVPGLAVAVIRDGQLAWAQGIGYADLATQKPVTTETVFNVGSISKCVAAWGLMQLVERDLVGLDDPVAQSLTRWKLPASDFNASGVTLRRLLSHTAGLSLSYYPGFAPDDELPSLEASLSGATNGSGDVRLVHEPGSKWQYSGGGYTIAQLLLEEKTNQDFAVYMKEHVLLPLGMISSDYRWTDTISASAATPYDEDGMPIKSNRFAALAAAGLQTTVLDLARFAEASMANEPDVLHGVLKPETIRLMQQAVPPSSNDGSTGLGYQIMGYDGLQTVGHAGENVGWKAGLFLHISSGSGVVMLCNGSNGQEVLAPVYDSWARDVMAAEPSKVDE